MALKSLSTDNRLRAPLAKPKVSFNIDLKGSEDMNSLKESDPLPIVELKPFVQKVWRREKSFANTSDRCSSVNTNKSEKSSSSRMGSEVKSRDTDAASSNTSEGLIDDVTAISPPPRTSNSLPSRLSERYLTFYVSSFDDFKAQKEHLSKFVGESGFRPKSRLHPVVDPKNRKQIEHSVSIIPGFITRDDRTKTTLDEISDGESISRFYSCSPKAIGPEEIEKQQEIRIAGENIKQNKHQQSYNASPTPTKISNSSWHGSSVRHGSPASMLYQNKRNQRKRVKTPIYDHLDRTGTLPSLSINATILKSKGKKLDDAHSEDYTDYRDAFENEVKPNIGGIENSFVVLSKHGSPTKVERQLSFELEKNLSRFRKLKDYSPFEINPAELAKYYPPPTFNMTQGEASIRKAIASNAKRRRNFRGKETSRKQPFNGHFVVEQRNNQFGNGIRKAYNDVEHIDSYDSLYGPYNKFSETPFPDDEPAVPYDTPRSHAESKVSTKAAETQTIDVKIETQKKSEKSFVSETTDPHETQTPRTPAPQIIKDKPESNRADSKHENKKTNDKRDNKKVDSSNVDKKERISKLSTFKPKRVEKPVFQVQAVQMRPSPLPDSTIDASGRTFLTSDSIPQVTEVTS